MLRRLRIENLVLIREAELEPGAGLNAITGETGAGKTILAQAIGLLLGAKGDAGFVGPGADEAYVEAEFDLRPGLLDEDELEALARAAAGGRGRARPGAAGVRGRATRAYAWGRSAAREDLAAAGERLIAMSGQFEQRRLARPAYQLDVLDSFIGDEQLRLRSELRAAWRELGPRAAGTTELSQGAAAEESRLAELRALVEDTEGLEPGAEDALRARARAAAQRDRARRSCGPRRSPRWRPTRARAPRRSSAARSARSASAGEIAPELSRCGRRAARRRGSARGDDARASPLPRFAPGGAGPAGAGRVRARADRGREAPVPGRDLRGAACPSGAMREPSWPRSRTAPIRSPQRQPRSRKRRNAAPR